MRVDDLIKNLKNAQLSGDSGKDVVSICYDSRMVRPGALFVALRGARADGHSYLDQAVKNGASAVMVDETLPPEQISALAQQVAVITVSDTRSSMPCVAATLYNYPSKRLTIYAVTGTNGKTSTTYLINGVLRHFGRKTGVIGTIGAFIGDEFLPIQHTTPESADLQYIYSTMLESGVTDVVMEASSHAIHQKRMDCTEIDCAVFTNLTQDHLDYHKSMDEYFAVKAELFTRFIEQSDKKSISVVNVDDPWGRERLLPVAKGRVVTYGTAADAVYRATDLRAGAGGVCFKLMCPEGEARICLSLGGLFNAYNALAAAAVCLSCGIPLDAVEAGLKTVKSVPGRFEAVDCGQPFAVIVDYAHTPDGLENVLTSARKITENKLIVVFGCGGDRDRGKRPQMGRVAAELADECILTSDNPRSEHPEAIAADIIAGISDDLKNKLSVQLDRRSAIREAVSRGRQGDIIVVAGKGHEDYQIFADRTIEFDDRKVVRQSLQELGWT